MARAEFEEASDASGGTLQYDRIGRGNFVIPNPTVSILGSIQPGRLQAFLRDAARGEEGDDGLISRFQLLFWPEPTGKWIDVDRWPDSQARRRADRLFRTLDALDPADLNANPGDDGGPPYLRFDDQAQMLFDVWCDYLENIMLRRFDENPLVESHLAKYRKLVPALALLFHLADVLDRPAGSTGSAEVSRPSVEKAIQWSELLEGHARRVYGSLDVPPDVDAAQALFTKLSEGLLTDPFS